MKEGVPEPWTLMKSPLRYLRIGCFPCSSNVKYGQLDTWRPEEKVNNYNAMVNKFYKKWINRTFFNFIHTTLQLHFHATTPPYHSLPGIALKLHIKLIFK